MLEPFDIHLEIFRRKLKISLTAYSLPTDGENSEQDFSLKREKE